MWARIENGYLISGCGSSPLWYKRWHGRMERGCVMSEPLPVCLNVQSLSGTETVIGILCDLLANRKLLNAALLVSQLYCITNDIAFYLIDGHLDKVAVLAAQRAMDAAIRALHGCAHDILAGFDVPVHLLTAPIAGNWIEHSNNNGGNNNKVMSKY